MIFDVLIVGARLPNRFTTTGPGGPSVLTNMLVSIEARADAQNAWAAHGNSVADPHRLSALQFLVRGRKRPAQAESAHATDRFRGLRRQMPGGPSARL